MKEVPQATLPEPAAQVAGPPGLGTGGAVVAEHPLHPIVPGVVWPQAFPGELQAVP